MLTRVSIFVVIAVLVAPLAATIASANATGNIPDRHENYSAEYFTGMFAAVYTWVALMLLSAWGLYQLPSWIAGYTRETSAEQTTGSSVDDDEHTKGVPDGAASVRQHLTAMGREEVTALVIRAFDQIDLAPAEYLSELQQKETDGCLDDFLESCSVDAAARLAAVTVAVAQCTESHELVVQEVRSGIGIGVCMVWIAPLLFYFGYSAVQCSSNCDKGTCSGFGWGTCSACSHNYVGQYCQYAPAYSFSGCYESDHACGIYVRHEPDPNYTDELDRELDERDSASHTCNGAPKYRRNQTPAGASDLWLFRRNGYDLNSNYYSSRSTTMSYGWTVSSGIDAERCDHGSSSVDSSYYDYYRYYRSYAYHTDHELIGTAIGGSAYDDDHSPNVPDVSTVVCIH